MSIDIRPADLLPPFQLGILTAGESCHFFCERWVSLGVYCLGGEAFVKQFGRGRFWRILSCLITMQWRPIYWKTILYSLCWLVSSMISLPVFDLVPLSYTCHSKSLKLIFLLFLSFSLVKISSVGSEGLASESIARRNGFHYCEAPNVPLGAKVHHFIIAS